MQPRLAWSSLGQTDLTETYNNPPATASQVLRLELSTTMSNNYTHTHTSEFTLESLVLNGLYWETSCHNFLNCVPICRQQQ